MNATGTSQLLGVEHDYLDMWARSISDAMAQVTGGGVSVERLQNEEGAPAATAAPEEGLWVRLFAAKAGEQAFFLAGTDARRLAQWLPGGLSDEAAPLTPNERESIVQFFQQVATMFPKASWLGSQCDLEASGSERLGWEGAWQEAFRFSTSQGSSLVLHAHLSSDFVSALEAAQDADKKHAMSAPKAPSNGPLSARDANLDLLMDVELEITLRFGRREMLLGDLLNLAPGSVLELDQQVQDPVELLVGSKVIAWGEVVTVDGNYGLRVTGLASRDERLESLRK